MSALESNLWERWMLSKVTCPDFAKRISILKGHRESLEWWSIFTLANVFKMLKVLLASQHDGDSFQNGLGPFCRTWTYILCLSPYIVCCHPHMKCWGAGGGVFLLYITDLKVTEGSQIFTTSENRHQIRNSGTTCLPFEVCLPLFTVLFLKCIKDI